MMNRPAPEPLSSGSSVHTPDSCGWFHATSDRKSAEESLLFEGGEKEEGLFLVRPSGSSPGDFALSLLQGAQVLHLQVHRHREDAFFSIDGGPVVHGLEELVSQSSCIENAPWGCPLARPCPGGGPPPPDTRRHGRTNLLHRAVRQGDSVVVRELLRVGYATEAKDEDGRTAVHLACLGNHSELLAGLLAADAAPSGPDALGRHPLHYACEAEDPDLALQLLEAGASPQARDNNGWVPLHVAAARGHLSLIRVLLEYGAPSKPRTLQMELPVDLATQGNHNQCARVLESFLRPSSAHPRTCWLHGPHVDRECASRLLGAANDGAFLVRRGRRSGSPYVLSLAGPMSVFHFEIHMLGQYLHIDDGPLLPSLEHLVEHYSRFEDGLPVRLQYPLSPDEPPPVGPRTAASHHPLPTTAVISRDALRLGPTLGEGEFGSVLQGIWLTPDGTEVSVAVKRLREMSAGVGFAREAELMVDLRHPCVVRLLAVCLGPPLMMVQELVPLGSLLTYLHQEPMSVEEDVPRWAHQVACGMQYLQENRYLHRDLACRNLLLASPMQVKISDFGLSRALGLGSEYYRATTGGRWPLKWYAPESINFGTFSHASDIWAYGVTLWEIYSAGQPPYGTLTGAQVLTMVESGKRLPPPTDCPEWAYSTMLSCWNLVPEQRPTFAQLAALFAKRGKHHMCAGCTSQPPNVAG